MFNLEKYEFVNNQLKEILDNSSITACNYFFNNNKVEFAEVTYKNGLKKEICIDCADTNEEIISYIKHGGGDSCTDCRFQDVEGECYLCGNTIYYYDDFERENNKMFCRSCLKGLDEMEE